MATEAAGRDGRAGPVDRVGRLITRAQQLLAAGVLVFAASTVLRAHAGHQELLDAWLYSSLTLSAGALVLLRGLRGPGERSLWLLMGVGLTLSALGDVVFSWLGGDQAPFPSVADVLYLALYPCSLAALALLLRARLRDLPSGVWLDGVIAALAVGAVSSAVAFGPISDGDTGDALAVAVGLAYPLGDLLLLGVAVAVLAMLGLQTDRRLVLLSLAFVLLSVADTYYLLQVVDGTYLEGRWPDALWPTGHALAAWAAWRPQQQVASRLRDGATVLVAPLAGTAAAAVVLVVGTARTLPGLAVVLATLTLLAVAVRLVLSFREVSSLADSRRQAHTDELTGLPNRRALLAELEHLPGGTAGAAAAMLLVDLDRFKEVNDSLGHHTGDELLRQVAGRLSGQARPGDLLARLGGDEFAVLLTPGSDEATAVAVADRLVRALDAPFALQDVSLHLGASVGVGLFPAHTDDPLLLLQRADVAMYAAKRARGHVALYRAEDDPPSKARLQTIEALRAALDNGELACHYQPQVRVDTGVVGGVEALVRWQHPTRGLLAPAAFLPLAEQAGLMRPLTLAVLDMALGQAARWRAGGTSLTVAVNLSVTSLIDADLPGDVGRLLNTHDLPASALVLEITENVLMADSERSAATVAALHQLGVGLSIDDYGTGYSSLAYLQDLAVDELKLDRVFTARLASDPRSAAIVRSTIELAHSLGLQLVAEGVEDAATLELLQRYGADVTQGYHHSPPLPPDLLLDWLHEHAVPFTPRREHALRVVSTAADAS